MLEKNRDALKQMLKSPELKLTVQDEQQDMDARAEADLVEGAEPEIAGAEEDAPESDAPENHGESTRVIGRWKVVSQIGKDYLGSIYLVEDTQDQSGAKARLRLLNSSLSSNRRIAKRFLQEANKSALLTHRNIAMVLDYGNTEDGLVYVVSECIKGKTLSEIIETDGFLDVEETLNFWIQFCDALEEAHHHGVLHRALKPGSIIIQETGGVKLIDFGLEKAIPPSGRVTQAISQILGELGDPRYMSPEQCLGGNVDQRSDIYALGCVIYHMLTGKELFASYKGLNIIMAHAKVVPPPLCQVMYNSEIPASVEAVLMKMLEKRPEGRYQTARELKEDVEALIAGKVPVHVQFSPAGRQEKTKHIKQHSSPDPLPRGREPMPPPLPGTKRPKQWQSVKPQLVLLLSTVFIVLLGLLSTFFLILAAKNSHLESTAQRREQTPLAYGAAAADSNSNPRLKRTIQTLPTQSNNGTRRRYVSVGEPIEITDNIYTGLEKPILITPEGGLMPIEPDLRVSDIGSVMVICQETEGSRYYVSITEKGSTGREKETLTSHVVTRKHTTPGLMKHNRAEKAWGDYTRNFPKP